MIKFLLICFLIKTLIINICDAQCSPGTYLIAPRECYRCEPGYYCDGQSIKPCQPGTFTLFGEAKCKICPSGNYANKTASSACERCPHGYYCENPALTPIPCPLGTYSFSSIGVITSCTKCENGTYANKTASSACERCPHGYYCTNPAATPIPCPLGTYSFSSIGVITSCTKCENGTFTVKTGSVFCDKCPNGYSCENPAVAPTPCPLGTYSFSYNGLIASCTKCENGTYANKTASSFCSKCLNGYYCENPAVAPTPCPLGTYSFSYNGLIASCTKCENGTYANNTLSTSCGKCPDGYSCCDPRVSPKLCPPGTYSFSWSGSITSCTKCEIGSYSNITGALLCSRCPDGYSCCDPRFAPKPCPPGTYSINSGQGISQCSKCPTGSWSSEASSYCTNCGNKCPTNVIDVDSLKCNPITIDPQVLTCTNIEYKYSPNLKNLADNGNCSFYNQLDDIKNCGSDGYLLKYGLKYCQKFADHYDDFNDDGKLWVNSVRKCLMNKLYNNTNNMNCDLLRSYAFDSHVECYLNPGYSSKSLCDILKLKNFLGLWNVYDLKDFLSEAAFKQIISVIKNCATYYTLGLVC